MYKKIASLLLLVLVVEDVVSSCRQDLIGSCENYHTLTDSNIKLLDPDNIDTECKKYDGLFSCITPLIGNCDINVRIRWQPIQKQIHTLCTTSKTAYIETGICWTDEETEYFIEECNVELQENIKRNPCGTLETYVVCLQEAAEDFCSDEAGEVIAALATSYVSVMKDALGCETTTPATTIASTTPHEASSSTSHKIPPITSPKTPSLTSPTAPSSTSSKAPSSTSSKAPSSTSSKAPSSTSSKAPSSTSSKVLTSVTTAKSEQDVVRSHTSRSYTLTTLKTVNEDQGKERLEQDIASTNTTVSPDSSTRTHARLQTHSQTSQPTISKTGALSGAASAITSLYIAVSVSLVKLCIM